MASWAASRISSAVYDYGVRHEWLARPAGAALWGTDTRLLFSAIQAIAALPDGAAVLDVPCGGGVALRGTRPGLRYVAADLSPIMLDRARRLAAAEHKDAEFVEADITRLPFRDGEFDMCVCFNGLHCLPEPALAVRELARCLRPGGRLVGDTIVRGGGLRQDLAITAFHRLGYFGPGSTATELMRWLTGAGLDVNRFERSGAVVHFTVTR